MTDNAGPVPFRQAASDARGREVPPPNGREERA
jgi:hypothetical protein